MERPEFASALANDAVDDWIQDHAKMLQRKTVQHYMEGGFTHPGFLLPWEEQRQDQGGFYYFVDLVTRETTWRQERQPGERRLQLHDRTEVLGMPPEMHFSTPEHHGHASAAAQATGKRGETRISTDRTPAPRCS
jgi:hypothetical protein